MPLSGRNIARTSLFQKPDSFSFFCVCACMCVFLCLDSRRTNSSISPRTVAHVVPTIRVKRSRLLYATGARNEDTQTTKYATPTFVSVQMQFFFFFWRRGGDKHVSCRSFRSLANLFRHARCARGLLCDFVSKCVREENEIRGRNWTLAQRKNFGAWEEKKIGRND